MFVLCVCAVCEDMRQNAVSEEEKVLAMTSFQQHIENAQEECSFYKCTAKEKYDIFHSNGHIPECSYEVSFSVFSSYVKMPLHI